MKWNFFNRKKKENKILIINDNIITPKDVISTNIDDVNNTLHIKCKNNISYSFSFDNYISDYHKLRLFILNYLQ